VTRRCSLVVWLFLTAGLAACRTAATPALDVFPETVAGVWRRTALRDVPLSEAPSFAPRGVIRRIRAAAYDGPGKIEARVYEAAPDVGLELIQHWRPAADTVVVYDQKHFQYVVEVKWESADRKALQEFVSTIESRLISPGR
jgi:hypothetical protein